MVNIFIFPAANPVAQKHYQETIEDGYDLNKVLPLVDDQSLKALLKDTYSDDESGNDKCYVWGAKPGGTNDGTWRNMKPGDLALGYRDKSVICVCRIVGKLDSPTPPRPPYESTKLRHGEMPLPYVPHLPRHHPGLEKDGPLCYKDLQKPGALGAPVENPALAGNSY